MPATPEGYKKLTANVPRELHRRVRETAYLAELSIDKWLEGLLGEYFRGVSPKEGYTTDDTRQFHLGQELPESFLRDAVAIYASSLDEWTALSRVTAAVARGQESLRAGSSDRPRLGPVIKPLPVEQPEDDTKDRTG